MALVSYSTGTVTVSAGGTTVTGAGTIWSGANVRPGDILQIGNFQTIISDVVDTDTLTIPPWGGGAQTDVAYNIWQWHPQRVAGAQVMQTVDQLVAAMNTTGFFVFVATALTEPDPSLGNEGQYAFQPTTGKMWVKSAGAWSYLGIFKAFQLKGAWSGATAYTVGDVVSLSGSSYACILDHTNHTPPNTTYWQLLAERGTDGDDGAAATVAVGTVTTGAGGSAASVTNSGTSSAAVFDFTIPAGKSYGGTSATSLAIGTGSKAFTTQAGLAYQDGARVRASSAADTSNWMEGLATYSGTSLTIAVDKTNGSGTHADWNFNVVGQPGAGDLSSANNLSDLASIVTARTNLGAVGVVKVQKFTSSGTYTPDPHLLYAIIECVGGGGGGGGCNAIAGNQGAAGGGGGGSYSRTISDVATVGASQTVTIGAGGAGVAASTGNAGGDTSVGSLCIGKGGAGGSGGVFGAGGAGGIAGTGDFTVPGQPGGPGNYFVSLTAQVLSTGAPGGSAGLGFGAGGLAVVAAANTATNGNAGGNYGGGGSSGATNNVSANSTGGAGAPGVVIITEFCSQ
ncbi:glycine-rich domain-containing protein [Bradyrhizobium liaoningense]